MATNKETPAATPEDKKEQYWGEGRNKRRRERYQADGAYKQSVIQRARRTQFDTRRAQGLEVREGENCKSSLSQLGSFDVREVLYNDQVIGPAKVVTAEELAGLLNRDPQVLYRWMGKNMLPRPVFEAVNDRNRKQAVYTIAEARAIIHVFSAHQEFSLYYRSTHTETIQKIYHAVAAARQQMGVSDDADTSKATAVH